MAILVYLLCALTSLGCAALLVRSHLRNRSRVLFWSALCFCGLFLNNALLFTDYVGVLDLDLARARTTVALLALLLLLYGLISLTARRHEP
jgi:uncharacterized membrane protein YiaA